MTLMLSRRPSGLSNHNNGDDDDGDSNFVNQFFRNVNQVERLKRRFINGVKIYVLRLRTDKSMYLDNGRRANRSNKLKLHNCENVCAIPVPRRRRVFRTTLIFAVAQGERERFRVDLHSSTRLLPL